MISLLSTRWTSASYSAPLGSSSGNTGAGSRPPSGGCRAENSEIRPRTLSISCRSVTRSRSFSIDSRFIRSLPSTTTSTSNSAEGNRRVTSSNCLNSGVSERNNWLSESSTLSRSTPKAATMQSATRMMADTIGARSGIRPIRSMP